MPSAQIFVTPNNVILSEDRSLRPKRKDQPQSKDPYLMPQPSREGGDLEKTMLRLAL